MNKKLVWVVIVGLFLILPASVLSWPYAVKQTDNVANRDMHMQWDGTIEWTRNPLTCSTPTAAKTSLKILSTAHPTNQFYIGDVTGCVYTPKMIDGSYVTADTFKSAFGEAIGKTGSKCIDFSNIRMHSNEEHNDQQINPHFVVGGYMYVTQKGNYPLQIFVTNGGAGNVDADAYVVVFNVDQKTNKLLSSVDLDTRSDHDFLFASAGNIVEGWCTHRGNVTLDPGLYYILINMNFDNEVRDGEGTDHGYYSLYYGTQPTASGTKWTPEPTQMKALSSLDYKIYSDPLTTSQLESMFTSDTINKAFCEAAGGSKNSDPVIADLYGCCRPALNGITRGNYVCDGTEWKQMTNEEYCDYLAAKKGISAENAQFNDPVGQESAGSIFTPFNLMLLYGSGSDGCCGDDLANDFGFVGGNKQYLCYDTTFPAPSTVKYNWLNAMQKSYQILTLNETKYDWIAFLPTAAKTGNQIDVVSNSEQWFYCNATLDDGDIFTSNPAYNAMAIPEGASFSERYSDGKYSCADLLTAHFATQGLVFENTCRKGGSEVDISVDGPYDSNCCMKINGQPQSEYSAESCDYCYMAGSSDEIVLFPPVDGGSSPDIPPEEGDSDIDKDLCVIDPELCLDSTVSGYDPLKNCNAQETIFKNTVNNTDNNFCTFGMPLPTLDSTATSKCCFGPNANWIPKSSIKTESDCIKPENGGIVYGAGYECGRGRSISLDSGLSCCFGPVSIKYDTASVLPPSNESFICFKETGDNIISQCCYDSTCANADYSTSGDIERFDKRVLTKGSAVHTIKNYDKIIKTGNSQLIVDVARRYIINDGGANRPKEFSFIQAPNLTGFSYLEFDVLTDSQTIEISLNGDTYKAGRLFSYSTNGNQDRVWHHISIPLTGTGLKTLSSIKVFDPTNPLKHSFIVDNIVLVPNELPNSEDLKINTKNYYCTGGFEGWIDDLDPPSGLSASFTNYGKYMFACTGIASYGWTGSQCCGDDTKIKNFDGTNNYGEYYSDSLAGCFKGSKITNDRTVAETKNIKEFSDPVKNEELLNYEYNDIL
ncbi:MAG TPA: hypothetical protein VEC16_02180, partial [Alphaproteobacteria bacterium]|nr:hypothetical protein [Alphaproteobacteria bacterium]